MKVLALDTATAPGGAALLHGAESLGVISLTTTAGQAQELPRTIVHLLHQADMRPEDLDLVAITSGPGSFIGVRIAMGVAKGMALALRIPLIGVGTLEALAASALPATEEIVSLIDARRGEVFAGIYAPSPDIPLTEILAPCCLTPTALVNILATRLTRGPHPGYRILNLELPTIHQAILAQPELADCCHAAAHPSVDPVQVARLAMHHYDRKGPQDWSTLSAQLEPLYLRSAGATPPKPWGG